MVALDSADGGVLWEYRRTDSKLCELTSATEEHELPTPEAHLVTSPNGRFAMPLGNFRAVRSFSATQLVLERSDGTQAIFDPESKTLRESRVPVRGFLPFKQQ